MKDIPLAFNIVAMQLKQLDIHVEWDVIEEILTGGFPVPRLLHSSPAELFQAGQIGPCNNCHEGRIEDGELRCLCPLDKCDFAYSDELMADLKRWWQPLTDRILEVARP